VTDLHHREAGDPGDPAVLLVHGYPESSYMWREILPALAGAGLSRPCDARKRSSASTRFLRRARRGTAR
jgi:pimeloyl-ACP methyl ester carboxylesterase